MELNDYKLQKENGNLNVDPHVAAYFETKSTVIEQYRMLRTNIEALNTDRPVNTLLFTSALRDEGKSITVLNLAIVSARDANRKTVVIDCDLHRPSIKKLLGLRSENGIADVLFSDISLDSVLYPTDIENLTVLPSGNVPGNPSELISSDRLALLFDKLKRRYDLVLIDSPPVMSITDAGILSTRVDGVILVVKAGTTSRKVVSRAKELIENAKGKVLGCILTNIRDLSPYYIYKYKS